MYYENTGVLEDVEEGELIVKGSPMTKDGKKIKSIDVIVRVAG
jgi:hypothetical protein